MARQRRQRQLATGMKAGSLLQYFSVQQPITEHDARVISAPLSKAENVMIPGSPKSCDDCAEAKSPSSPLQPAVPSHASVGASPSDTTSHVVPVIQTGSSALPKGLAESTASDLVHTSPPQVIAPLDSNESASVEDPATPDEAKGALKGTLGHSSSHSHDRQNKKVKLDDSALCAYEQERLAKIRQNAAFLASLGIDHLPQPRRTSSIQKPKPRRRPPSSPPPVALRRSSRQLAAGGVDSAVSTEEPTPKQPPTRQPFDVFPDTSVLVQYLCDTPGNPTLSQSVATECSTVSQQGRGFATTPSSHDRVDTNLKRVYSMASTGRLLVAAGHNGYLSLYSCDVAYQSTPLLSFRAHQGWCSGVNFNLTSPAQTRMITAANDGFVKLWAVDPSTLGLALLGSTNLHSNSGIFSLDVQTCDAVIATGSKDYTVALSAVTQSHLQLVRTLDHHTGVVKCVRFSATEPTMLASCGNDLTVQITDLRCRSSVAATCLVQGGHTRAVNR
ncbi:hypothetical protein, variant [Aphanomyces astaci]|uniref:Uncharacterized protein n=1 Tax=Aphanomyces astaci TaxID=112090 RepID=W4G3S3_APHAT|nr:hypothetical protein, variant [Aphanomyces astaci]ETV73936.1 hypothetical protein, variant [Aphanomyces astaci]|eukprot:XP_009836448.1 hypothetical protein, variant [Aphanomyces astaci]